MLSWRGIRLLVFSYPALGFVTRRGIKLSVISYPTLGLVAWRGVQLSVISYPALGLVARRGIRLSAISYQLSKGRTRGTGERDEEDRDKRIFNSTYMMLRVVRMVLQ